MRLDAAARGRSTHGDEVKNDSESIDRRRSARGRQAMPQNLLPQRLHQHRFDLRERIRFYQGDRAGLGGEVDRTEPAGGEYDWKSREFLPNNICKPHAVHSGHNDVRKQDVNLHAGIDYRQCVRARKSAQHATA